MIRVGRSLEILEVACDTGGAGQVVVIVDMAVGAEPRGHYVRTREGEAGRGMVELAIRPEHGVMALFAGGWKSAVWYWRGGLVVIRLMAADASRACDAVIVVDVAIGALTRRYRV